MKSQTTKYLKANLIETVYNVNNISTQGKHTQYIEDEKND